MKNVFKRIPAICVYYLLLLFFSIHSAGVSANNAGIAFIQSSASLFKGVEARSFFKLQQEDPKFTNKSSEEEGNKIIYTFNISVVNPSVEKVMEEIRQTHKPGATIAYEFHQFQLDAKNKTLKVVIDKNVITQQELLAYLQTRLNNALKQMK
jgi:hypothetical protein